MLPPEGLDPRAEAEVLSAAHWQPPKDLATARAAYDAAARLAGGRPEPDVRTEDSSIAGVPVRWYVPPHARSGTFLYVPGGGWVFGHPSTHDAFTRVVAARASMNVVSVAYRRSPEARAPAALEDVTRVLSALREDHGPLFLGGDSAGGLLAALACTPEAGVRGCVLLYPALDPTLASPAYDLGLPPVRVQMRWFWEQYLGRPEAEGLSDATPLTRPVPIGLPPHLLLEATHDPLRDEGQRYRSLLEEAGTSVTVRTYSGQIHGFARQVERFPAALSAAADVAAFLDEQR